MYLRTYLQKQCKFIKHTVVFLFEQCYFSFFGIFLCRVVVATFMETEAITTETTDQGIRIIE